MLPSDQPHADAQRVDAPERLEALRRTDLMDSAEEVAFDRLTALVTRTLGVPVALVSLVDAHRQFFKSAVGLPADWAAARGTPLSRSFCQHVVTADAPLVVPDARNDERVQDNPAIEEAGVIAYLGAPVHGPGGAPIGSLCAIASEPRAWTPDEVQLLVDLAAAASDLIALRTATVDWRTAVVDLSHDVRTALTALQLEADAAAHSMTDGDARESVQSLASALHEQSDVVSAALSRIAGGALGHEQDVDVLLLLERIVRELQAGGSDVRLDPVPTEPVGTVTVVEVELHRVVRGIVDVLLEHGTGDVTLTAVAGEGSVRIRVRSAAEGLPPAAVWQLTGRTDGGGSDGALAQRAAQRLGGRLVVLSARPPVADLLLPRRVT